jgi:hypothetical protein
LACFVAARLAAECTATMDEDSAGRAARCAGAKAWLGTLALPAAVRVSVTKCAELTVAGHHGEVGKEVATLIVAASSYLDPQSRAELEALSASIRN